MTTSNHTFSGPTRRDFLYGLGASLGPLALTSMLAQDSVAANVKNLTAPKPSITARPAKACIMLYMAGGPSHIDTFDPKPKLKQLHMKTFQRKDKFASAMASGKRYFVQSPFAFHKAGQSGIEMCEHWRHLAGVADDLCIYRGCTAESINHPTANYHMNTGNRFGGDPSIGAWVNYGLGSSNNNLPGYMVLPEVAFPQGGSANWSNGFLPPVYQGTQLRAAGSPILDLNPPEGISRKNQRMSLDLLAKINQDHAAKHPDHADLHTRMANYELAYRMQMQVPGILDISEEPEDMRELYGLNDTRSADFGRRCLLARRLVEQGVRFIHIFTAGWDSHDYINRAHSSRIQAVDKPMAGLIKDLKQRGMLDETLVFWTGEFGRSPDNGIRGGGEKMGRDHNAGAMVQMFAGGGVEGGRVLGATDEIGEKAVELVHPIRDVHCTLLRLMGLDDNKLTYFHGGRYKQLSQVGGEVITDIVGT